MNQNELKNLLSFCLKPLGFKQKGNKWYLKGEELTKVVTLQKLRYSNSYYVNYGYVINTLFLGSLEMHVFNQLVTISSDSCKKTTNLLNFENEIEKKERKETLSNIFKESLLKKLDSINSKDDLVYDLKSRKNLNQVPLVVKKYLKV